MTILISDNSPRISYTATAGQTAFTVPFEFFDASDLNVYINDTLQTLTTHYSVTGGSGSTGSITLVTGATLNDVVVITRDVTLERVTDFPTSGPFQVASLNTELDKVVAMIADMKDLADRGLRLSDSDTSATLVLANKDTRKGTVLAFNATTGAVEVGPTIADTNTVAQIKADISTVAGISANVTTVAGISSDVTTVATNDANVTTVAGQTTNMQNITDNLTAVQNAATNATTATTKASEAAASATAAATSETNAATSETNAATSATNASNSASAASTSASASATSATASANSATAAATSETNAGTSETNAASSASAASTSASNAATSATNSSSSATAAATSETNAATSATNAATSATAASGSATAAANSAAAAAAAFDNFDDTYLGSFSSDPTVDNDGDALVEGALYFNSNANEMRVYDGANWIAASSAGTASILEYNYTATAGQTTFTGSDDNSATLSYTAANLIVTLNGIVLENGTDYTASNGTSIVLTVGAAAGDELNVIAFKSFTVSDTVAASTGGTFSGNVAVNGDLTVDTNTLHVDSTNNRVGIGTSSPSDTLHIKSSAPIIRLEDSDNATYQWQVGQNTDVFFINTETASDGSQFAMDSSGNVGIGNSAPSEVLDIKSTSSAPTIRIHADTTSSPAPAIELQRGTNDTWGADIYTDFRIENSDGHIKFFGATSGTTSEYMRLENDKDLHVDGNVVAYSTTISDIRLKKDIAPIEDAVTKVQQLNGCTFTYLKDDRKSAGLIAQDVEKVLPSAVIEDEAVFHGEEGETYKTVQYDQVIGLLVEAVKELSAKVEELENASPK